MRFQPFVIPIVVIAGALELGCLILYPVFTHGKAAKSRSSCAGTLKQIALACAQYAEDNDEHFPVISRGEQGWADALIRYTKTDAVFHCPAVGKREERSSDYFLNARLANLKTSQLKSPPQTISFGDGLPHGGTNSHFSEMPFDWEVNENSPAQRHQNGANYVFADGHVKWARPEKISTHSPSRGDGWIATFAVR